MNDRLIVRVYNVGFGDCIFLQVPQEYKDQAGKTHKEVRCILIDCGLIRKPKPYLGPEHPLTSALNDVLHSLPERDVDNDKEKTLDLLVLTHPHQDHLSGLRLTPEAVLKSMRIEHIWLSALMYPKHEQAKGFRALRAAALAVALSAVERGRVLPRQLRTWWEARLSGKEIIRELKQLPGKHKTGPLYVWRDIADKSAVKVKSQFETKKLLKSRKRDNSNQACPS